MKNTIFDVNENRAYLYKETLSKKDVLQWRNDFPEDDERLKNTDIESLRNELTRFQILENRVNLNIIETAKTELEIRPEYTHVFEDLLEQYKMQTNGFLARVKASRLFLNLVNEILGIKEKKSLFYSKKPILSADIEHYRNINPNHALWLAKLTKDDLEFYVARNRMNELKELNIIGFRSSLKKLEQNQDKLECLTLLRTKLLNSPEPMRSKEFFYGCLNIINDKNAATEEKFSFAANNMSATMGEIIDMTDSQSLQSLTPEEFLTFVNTNELLIQTGLSTVNNLLENGFKFYKSHFRGIECVFADNELTKCIFCK